MLKTIYLNQKKVPVPIPIKNLYEALHWIEKHMLRDGHSITRVNLDNQSIDTFDLSEMNMRERILDKDSKLEIQIDSVQEISIQTIDALRNLAVVLGRSLKPTAVKCWQSESQDTLQNCLKILDEDLCLVLDLLSHVEILVRDRVSVTNIQILDRQLSEVYEEVQGFLHKNNGKSVAKVLLQKLEPILEELNHELSMLQNCVFEVYAEKQDRIKVGQATNS